MPADVADDRVLGECDKSDARSKRKMRMVFPSEVHRHPRIGRMDGLVRQPAFRHGGHVGRAGEPELKAIKWFRGCVRHVSNMMHHLSMRPACVIYARVATRTRTD